VRRAAAFLLRWRFFAGKSVAGGLDNGALHKAKAVQ
jgi:hypothetical protein